MRRLTYDTNIYISALQFGGRLITLLRVALDGEVEVAISEPIIHETPRVLQEKFGWPEERLKEALTIMESCATKAMPDQSLNVAPGDVDDNRIIECAIAAGSEAIVTGDKDLLRLGSYQGIKMIQAREILGWAR